MTKTLSKDTIYQYGNSLHHLKSISPSEDPLVKSSIQNLNNTLNDTEKQVNRPVVSTQKSNNDQISEFKAKYNTAFVKYLRKGIETDLQQVLDEAKKMNYDVSGMQNSNGYSVTDVMSQIFNNTLYKNSPVRQFAKKINTSKDIVDVAGYNNEIVCAWGDSRSVAEVSESFSRKTIRVYDLTAQPKITQRMVDDQDLDIETWIAELIANTFLMEENEAFISGNGVNKPQGILSYPAGSGLDKIERVTNGDSNNITFEGLMNLQSSLNISYENNGELCFLASKNAISQIRTLKDSAGRYIWTSGILESKNDLLFGIPLLKINSLETLAPNSDAMIYGNLKRGYQIVDKSDIKIQRDPFSSKPFIVYFATKTVGGDVIDTNAIKVLKMA